MIVHGSLTFLRGVAIVVVPLLTVGTDQTRSARRHKNGSRAYHVDGLEHEGKSQLIALLDSLESRVNAGIILYVSPAALDGTTWAPVVKSLFRRGIVSLAVVDEAHMAVIDGRYFRPEFKKLKSSLWALAVQSPKPVARLTMTATFTAELRDEYTSVMGENFTHSLWGDVSRRELHLCCCVCTQPTQPLKSFIARHLAEVDRKVIVYTNDASAATGGILKSSQATIASTDSLDGDVMALTGNLGVVLKSYIVSSFTSKVPSAELNLRLLISSPSGFCGIDPPLCGAVGFHGFPSSLEILAQSDGQSGTKLGYRPFRALPVQLFPICAVHDVSFRAHFEFRLSD